jgi:ureidoacrylate peracid hydrolase
MVPNIEEYIIPSRSAVLVIDMQNDFCHNEGVFGKGGQNLSAIQDMAGRLGKFVDEARKLGILPVHVMSHLDDAFLPPPAVARNRQLGRDKGICLKGSWGAEFYKILPADADTLVTKHAYSAFVDTDLKETLLGKGIQSLFVTGVLTNVCCESTLRHGFMLGFYTFLVEDCCASVDEATHLAAVDNVRKYFGWVSKSDETLKFWKQVRS